MLHLTPATPTTAARLGLPAPAPRLARLLLAALALDGLRRHGRTARLQAELASLRTELATQQQRAESLAERLRAEAETDPLTGLANRRRWQRQLEHEAERAARTGAGLAVAVVDLDRFKQVNDTLGHAAGDALLRQVADCFSRSVRTVDLVARLGGEEFGVALPDAVLPDVVGAVDRLRRSLPPGVTCSAGLAVWDGTESLEQLQARADAAMFRAKHEGRDRLHVA